jgi:hypothetical protein
MAKEVDHDDDLKDSSLVESGVEHAENVALDADQMTAWQCIINNPKIVLWTFYANRKSSSPIFHHGLVRHRRKL